MAQLKWDFINPVNYGAANQLYQQGNEQISKAIQGAGQAVIGYGEGIKKQQTDEILNALYQAQNPDQLSGAMANVNALQRQFGRGFDQAAVRKEVDARGTTLNQQALNQIQLTQAQNQQASIDPINQLNVQRLVASGMSPEQAAAYGNLKVDNTAQVTTAIGDSRDSRDYKYKVGRDLVADTHWNKDFVQRGDQFNKNYALAQNADTRSAIASDIATAGYLAPNAGTSSIGYDSEGNAVTTQQPSRAEALNAAHDVSGAYANVRGIRNNNPGNLQFAGQKGASRENGSGRFASFQTPEAGIGAMSKQLDLHFNGTSAAAKKAGKPLQSVNDIIHAWAPTSENDTAGYIARVSKTLGVSPTAKLNLQDPKVKTAFMKAIVTHENGGNPYSDAVYAAGISGKPGTASTPQALVPQANMAKVTSNYQTNVAKITNDFNISEAKAKTKGSLASTGKNVDTWLASKKEFSLSGGSANPMYTRSADIAKMARMEPAFNNLSAESQLKVLDGAFGFVDSTGLFQYVPNDTLKKFIKDESTRVISDNKNQFAASKQAVFETSYQEMVREYKAVGAKPPSREVAMKIFDPQSPAKAAVNNVAKADPAKVKIAQEKQQAAKAARIKADEAVAKARALNTKLAQERKEKAELVAASSSRSDPAKRTQARLDSMEARNKENAAAAKREQALKATKALERQQELAKYKATSGDRVKALQKEHAAKQASKAKADAAVTTKEFRNLPTKLSGKELEELLKRLPKQ